MYSDIYLLHSAAAQPSNLPGSSNRKHTQNTQLRKGDRIFQYLIVRVDTVKKLKKMKMYCIVHEILFISTHGDWLNMY